MTTWRRPSRPSNNSGRRKINSPPSRITLSGVAVHSDSRNLQVVALRIPDVEAGVVFADIRKVAFGQDVAHVFVDASWNAFPIGFPVDPSIGKRFIELNRV